MSSLCEREIFTGFSKYVLTCYLGTETVEMMFRLFCFSLCLFLVRNSGAIAKDMITGSLKQYHGRMFFLSSEFTFQSNLILFDM